MDVVYPWGNEPDPNRANYDETGIEYHKRSGMLSSTVPAPTVWKN